MTKIKPFGYSFMLDLYGCRKGLADDIGFCYDFLEKLVDFLKMQKQSPPFIFRTDEKFKEMAGLSGWVPLIESGVQIHTLTPKDFISIDVYSCCKFDPKKVEFFTKKHFKPKKIEKRFTIRGKEYHK